MASLLFKVPEKYKSDSHGENLLLMTSEEFESSFNVFDDDIFLLACQNNDSNKIKFLIDKDFGLNFISDDRTTGFTFLCYNGDVSNINYLLDKNILPKSFFYIRDKNGNLPFHYLKNNVDNTFIYRIKRMSVEDEIFNNEFKIYTFNDFDVVSYDTNFEGTYGNVIHGIHKESGLDMIIKKYIKCEEMKSIVKEIAYLKYINKLNPQIAVLLYGLIHENDCIYLVEEYMTHTLREQFHFVKKLSNSEKHIKDLLYELITLINWLNGLGFAHNDIKFNNIMFSSSGKMKLIDFGISNYIGLMPTIYMIDKYLCIEEFKAPDTSQSAVRILNSDGKIIRIFPDLYRSLTNDMFSLGVNCLVYLLKLDLKPYFIYEGKLYTKDHKGIYEEVETLYTDFNEFLYKLIEFYPKNRYHAKDALKDEYFTGVKYDPIKKPTKTFNILPIRNMIPYANDKDRELYYKEEIFKSILFLKFTEVPEKIDSESINEKMLVIFSEWLLIVTEEFETNYNVYFNTMILIRILINSNMIRQNLQGYGSACFMIYSFIFENRTLPYSDLSEITDNAFTVEELYKMTLEILMNKNKRFIECDIYNFVPVTTYVGYIIQKLQELETPPKTILTVYKNILATVSMYVTYNVKPQIYVWDIVRYAYYIFKEDLPDLDILNDIDDEKLERIKECNNSESDRLNFNIAFERIN